MNRCGKCRKPLGRYARGRWCSECNEAGRQESIERSRGRVPASREVLQAEVAGWFRRWVAEAALEREVTEVLTRTAWHEAGHTVVALDLGMPVEEVSIGFGRGGRTLVHNYRGAEVALAGALAERRFLGFDDAEGCEDDERTALEALDRGESADVARVEEILARRAHDVEAIAEALLENERLSASDIEALLSVRGVTHFRADEWRSAAPVAGRWVDPEWAGADFYERRAGPQPAPGWVRNPVHGGWEPERAEEIRSGWRTRTYAWTPPGPHGPGCGCGEAA